MPSRIARLMLLLASTLLAQAEAGAANYCVGTVAEFDNALAALQNSGTTNVIRMRAGTYLAPAGGLGNAAALAAGTSLVIEGGWYTVASLPCIVQNNDPALTVVDGQGTRPGMELYHFAGSGDVTVRNVTFKNGFRGSPQGGGSDRGAGLYIYGSGGYTGNLVVERCAFRDNDATFLGGGLYLASDGGAVIVRDNLAVGNSARNGAAFYVFGNGNVSAVVNNTAAANVGTVDTISTVTLAVGGSNAVVASNNVFWGNTNPTQYDLYGPQQILVDNDVQRIYQDPAMGSAGNLSVDPLFVGQGDYRLRYDSPLVDAGANNPYGGTGTLDLEGLPRQLGAAVDIGASEVDNLFRSSFD